MLHKLRWKFILIASGSVLAVLIVIVIGVNFINYNNETEKLDKTIDAIAIGDRKNKIHPQERGDGPKDERVPLKMEGEDLPPEAEFTTRYFRVLYNEDGSIQGIDLEFISSISNEEATQYAQAVLKKEKDRGYYGDFRYHLVSGSDGNSIVFLNSNREVESMKNVLVITLLVAVIAFAAVFLLVFLLSKKAIQPFVSNMEKQRQFITDASHELKTPLTSISTSAEVLAMEHEEDEWVLNIKKQTHRLSKLVESLVALTRMDETKPQVEKIDFSVSDIAWETSEPFAARAKAEGKGYEEHIEDDINTNGDRNGLQQLLSILLDNAVKYTNAEGTIALKVYRKHRDIIIEVNNSTDGVDKTHLDQWFERFYRADASRATKTGGTGIGLSIAKAVADANKWKIKAKSIDGKQITFKVVIKEQST